MWKTYSYMFDVVFSKYITQFIEAFTIFIILNDSRVIDINKIKVMKYKNDVGDETTKHWFIFTIHDIFSYFNDDISCLKVGMKDNGSQK